MLDNLSDETWNYWYALSLIDDWGVDKLATLAANTHNSLMVAAVRLHGSIDESDFKTSEDFERRFRWERKRKKHPVIQDGTAQFDLLKKSCGF